MAITDWVFRRIMKIACALIMFFLIWIDVSEQERKRKRRYQEIRERKRRSQESVGSNSSTDDKIEDYNVMDKDGNDGSDENGDDGGVNDSKEIPKQEVDSEKYKNHLLATGGLALALNTVLCFLKLSKDPIVHAGQLGSISNAVFGFFYLSAIVAFLESFSLVAYNSCRAFFVLTLAWLSFLDTEFIPDTTTGFVLHMFYVYVICVFASIYLIRVPGNRVVACFVGFAFLYDAFCGLAWLYTPLGFPSSMTAKMRQHMDVALFWFSAGMTSFATLFLRARPEQEEEIEEDEEDNKHQDNGLQDPSTEETLPSSNDDDILAEWLEDKA